MKTSIAATLAALALAPAAHAQPNAPPSGSAPEAPSTGYILVVAQSAFGNVTSQSFGGELGITLQPRLQLFVDAGKIRDAAPASLGASAQTIAAGIARAAGSADFHVRQPITFGVAGVKYSVPVSSHVQPYLLGGAGLAKVTRDVTFTTPAGDVNQFVTLGTDLAGSETKAMLSVGGGVGLPISRVVILDLQYRYGRVFTSDGGLNTNRAGIGIGIRF